MEYLEEYKPEDVYEEPNNSPEEGGGNFPVLDPEQTEALRKAIREARTSE